MALNPTRILGRDEDRIAPVAYFGTTPLIGAPGLVINTGTTFTTGVLNVQGASGLTLFATWTGGSLAVAANPVDPETEVEWVPGAATIALSFVPGAQTANTRRWSLSPVMTGVVIPLWMITLRISATVANCTISRAGLYAYVTS